MKDAEISIRLVTKDNLDEVLALKVEEDQRGFVSTTAESLAQAYVYGDTAFPFAIYHGEDVVGFIMMGYYKAKDYYTLWKFLIDKKHQGKGYGRIEKPLRLESFLRLNYLRPFDMIKSVGGRR